MAQRRRIRPVSRPYLNEKEYAEVWESMKQLFQSTKNLLRNLLSHVKNCITSNDESVTPTEAPRENDVVDGRHGNAAGVEHPFLQNGGDEETTTTSPPSEPNLSDWTYSSSQDSNDLPSSWNFSPASSTSSSDNGDAGHVPNPPLVLRNTWP